MQYTFEFEDGSKVSYDAESLNEAIQMKNKEHGNRSWTINFSEIQRSQYVYIY